MSDILTLLCRSISGSRPHGTASAKTDLQTRQMNKAGKARPPRLNHLSLLMILEKLAFE